MRDPVAAALRYGDFERGDEEFLVDDIVADPVAWVEATKPKIESKRYGVVPFEPYDYQAAIMRAIADSKSLVIPKSRQLGVSTAVIMGYVHQLLYKAEQFGIPLHCHIVANKEEVSVGRLLRIAKFALQTAHLTAAQRRNLKGIDYTTWVPEVSYDTSLAHNYIRAHTSGSNPGRSFGGNAALLEEVAAMPNAREVWKSLAPMLDDVPHSVVMLVSTYQGDGDFFCDCVDNAAEMGLTLLELDWDVHPDRDEEWMERSQSRFLGRLADWEEEFALKRIHDGSKVVDIGLVKEYARDVAFLGNAENSSVAMPIPGHRYSKGIDLAGPGQDLTVLTAIDLYTKPPQVVYQKALPYLATNDRIAIIEDFDKEFPGAMFIDGTTDKAVPALIDSRNKTAVHITRGSQVQQRVDRVEGLKWKNVPRDQLMTWLTATLEQGKLIVHTENFPDLFRALTTAVLGEGQKRKGKNVDHLDSLALANMPLASSRGFRGGDVKYIQPIPSSERLTKLRGRRW